MTTRDFACLGLSLCAGTFVGFIELHSDEVSPTLATVLLVSVLLGFARPRWFWLWGIIVGLAVPLCYAVGPAVGVTPRTWPEPPGWLTYVGIGAFTVTCGIVASGIAASVARATRKGDDPA